MTYDEEEIIIESLLGRKIYIRCETPEEVKACAEMLGRHKRLMVSGNSVQHFLNLYDMTDHVLLFPNSGRVPYRFTYSNNMNYSEEYPDEETIGVRFFDLFRNEYTPPHIISLIQLLEEA